MVAQYLEGGQGGNQTDPALSLVPGSDTWLKSYRLSTPTGAAAFDQNYASIVISTGRPGFADTQWGWGEHRRLQWDRGHELQPRHH